MGEPVTQPGSDEQPTVAEPVASRRSPERASGGRLSDLPSGDASDSRAPSVITARETVHLQEIAILYKVVQTMPARPSEIAPLPPEIDLVLAVGLAKDPPDRFASAAELAQAVDAAARGRIEPDLRARAERLLSRLPWGAAR